MMRNIWKAAVDADYFPKPAGLAVLGVLLITIGSQLLSQAARIPIDVLTQDLAQLADQAQAITADASVDYSDQAPDLHLVEIDPEHDAG